VTSPAIKAHIDALVALLAPTVTVYVARAATGSTMPYVVLHIDQGTPSASALTFGSTTRLWHFQTTVAAAGWEQAVTVAAKVNDAVLDVRLNVPGDKCGPIRKTVSLMVERDEDMPTPTFMARDVWGYYSISAV
jgi:hypothetical protein